MILCLQGSSPVPNIRYAVVISLNNQLTSQRSLKCEIPALASNVTNDFLLFPSKSQNFYYI